LTRHYSHGRAPITPFVWACLIGLAAICLSTIAIGAWCYVQLTR
jgi:preprotein translocase subunit SecF